MSERLLTVAEVLAYEAGYDARSEEVTAEIARLTAELDAAHAQADALRRELADATEAQGEERAEDIARRIARDCRALHDRTPEEDATMRDALLDMAVGIEERLASIPGPARRREGDGVPILSAKNRNREEM